MGRFRDSGSDEGGDTAIDLSPMIDCVFILLIFFIVTTTFVEETGVEVDKPQAASAVQLEFFGITGKVYTVEESADLKTWTAVPFALAAQGAEQARYQAPEVGIRSIFVKAPSTTSRFYRLSVR